MNLFFDALKESFGNVGIPMWIDDQTAVLAKRSPLTGKITEVQLPMTPAQWMMWCSTERPLVQECFPLMSATQREFVMTGYTDADWNAMFPDEEDAE